MPALPFRPRSCRSSSRLLVACVGWRLVLPDCRESLVVRGHRLDGTGNAEEVFLPISAAVVELDEHAVLRHPASLPRWPGCEHRWLDLDDDKLVAHLQVLPERPLRERAGPCAQAHGLSGQVEGGLVGL